jgi:hypothetical protein
MHMIHGFLINTLDSELACSTSVREVIILMNVQALCDREHSTMRGNSQSCNVAFETDVIVASNIQVHL